jgi:hypothetical protein
MPQPVTISRATLTPILKDIYGNAIPLPSGYPTDPFEVQFNPQTLKFTYSVQTQSEQKGNDPATTQFIAKGTTKLALELWFDSALATAANRLTAQSPDGIGDVRTLTQQVAKFMHPYDDTKGNLAPPLVLFKWGNLQFLGVMDSMDESIDLFSPNGIALRASVNITISKQEIDYQPNGSLPQNGAPGTQPLQAAMAGANLAQMAAKAGISDWKSIATANNIDNPRQLATGTLLNLNVSV